VKQKQEVEGTPFTARRRDRDHCDMATAEGRAAFIQYMRRTAEFMKDPWKAQQPTIESIRDSLARERETHGDDYVFKPREDVGWYLSELASEATLIDRYVADRHASAAADAGIRFGRIYAEFELKCAREATFLVGMKVVQRGIDSRHGRTAAERRRAIDEMRATGTAPGKAIATVASEDGVTVKAVEKQYYKKNDLPG
jgi:hypothetical protein